MPSSPTWEDTQEAPSWDDTREPSEYDFVTGELDRYRAAVNAPRTHLRPDLSPEDTALVERTMARKPFNEEQFQRRLDLESQKRQAETEGIVPEMLTQIHDPIVPPRIVEKGLKLAGKVTPAGPILEMLPGVTQSQAEAISGFTSPVNLALAGAAGGGGALARGIAGGFAADMARHVPEAARVAGETSVTGTPEEAQKAITDVALQIGMAGVAGGGAFHGAKLPERGLLTKEMAAADNAARAGMNVGLNKSVEALKKATEEPAIITPAIADPPRSSAAAPTAVPETLPERAASVPLAEQKPPQPTVLAPEPTLQIPQPPESVPSATSVPRLAPGERGTGIPDYETWKTQRKSEGYEDTSKVLWESQAKALQEKQQLELPGEYSARAKVIADKLREQFKTDTGGKVFTGPVDIINAAVEIAARAIEAGGSVADAMAAAVKHIRENFKGDWDEAAFRKKFEAAVIIPDTAGESVKMRKSAEHGTTSPMIPEPVQERIADAPESFYKQQKTTRVEDAVKSLSDGELSAIPADSNLYVASKLEQADRRFKSGDNEGGYQIFVELEKQGTSFGQNINQFKRLAGTRPEHVAVLIDKKLQAAGKDPLTPEQRAKAIEAARLSKESDAALDRATDAWEKNPTPENTAAAEASLAAANKSALKLQEYVARFQPRSTSSILKSVLQGNLLTPISEVANVFGNVSFLPFRAIDRAVATGLDIIDAAVRKKPRELSVQPISGTVEAAKGAARGAKQISALLARGTGNVIKGETRAGLHPVQAWINQFSKNPEMPTTGGKLTLKDRLNLAIEGTFGVPAEAMLRGLGAGDAPFREAARARVTAEQLKLNKVPREQWAFAQKFPELFLPKEALETIHKDTMQAIFQRESKTLNLLTNWLKGKGEVVDFLAATVAPYKLTPWNIIGEILSYNPLIALAKGVRDAKAGNTRNAKLNAGKMVVGTMLTSAGTWLYQNGLLAPSLDERDEAQKARVLSGKVLPPNHINISGLKRAMEGGDPEFQAGDETVDVFRAGGLAGAMFYMTANIGRDLEKGPQTDKSELWQSIIRNSVLEQARFGLNQSFLQGIEGLLSAIKDGEGDNYTRRWANTVASITLPNTLNSLTKATRQYQIDPKGEDFKSSIQTMFKNKLGFAGLDDYLPLKRDFWGQPMRETPEGRNAMVYHFFDITKNKQVTSDPVEMELYRLWRKTGDTKVIPSIPERAQVFQKQTYALTPKQYERFAELVGTHRRQTVDAMVVNSEFHKLNDEQKLSLLTRAYDRGQQMGKAFFVQEFPITTLTPKAQRAGFRP